MVDANGAVVGTMKYWPFGMTRSGIITQTDKLYTGQQQEPGDELQLYHYGARVYSSLLGRFLSVDPIASGGPQLLNPYSYVANNPMRDVPAGGGAGTVYFLLADHLGSTTQVLSTAGVVLHSQTYWPYGEARSVTPPAVPPINGGGVPETDKQFTGQQNEKDNFDALQPYFYKARFYSPVIGVFLSPDPLVRVPDSAQGNDANALIVSLSRIRAVKATAGTPGELNRYSYGRQNPVRYSDPTGFCVGGLYCSPTVAFNTVACASGPAACSLVLYGMTHRSPTEDEIADAVRWSLAAVSLPQFWANFFSNAYNPWFGDNWDWILTTYLTGRLGDPVFLTFQINGFVADYLLSLGFDRAENIGIPVHRAWLDEHFSCVTQVLSAAAPWVAVGGGFILLFVPGLEGVGLIGIGYGTQSIAVQAVTAPVAYSFYNCQ